MSSESSSFRIRFVKAGAFTYASPGPRWAGSQPVSAPAYFEKATLPYWISMLFKDYCFSRVTLTPDF